MLILITLMFMKDGAQLHSKYFSLVAVLESHCSLDRLGDSRTENLKGFRTVKTLEKIAFTVSR